jgi:hypothetical protein
LLPTVTVPKFSLAVLGASCPLSIPLPESERVAELFEALLVMETVPLKVPAALGVKTKVIGAL